MSVTSPPRTPSETRGQAAAQPKKPFLHRRSGVWTVRVLAFVLIVGGWEVYAADLPRALLAPPSEVAVAFYQQLFVDGSLRGALSSSLLSLVGGFGLALLFGIPLGVAMGRSRKLEHLVDPYVMFLYAIPNVALVPLFVIWLGFDFKLRLAYVVISSIFPIVINVMTGVKNVSVDLIECGQSFCANERQKLRTIVLPSAIPYIMTGARQGLSHAWVGVVVAEMLATLTGLGGLILTYGNRFRTADMLVPIVAIMLLAVFLQVGLARLQSGLTPWDRDR